MNESILKTHLDSLWAPWRVEYFRAEQESGSNFLTEAAQTEDDSAHLVITRRKSTFLLMNKYPYSAGHLMAVTYRKLSEMDELIDRRSSSFGTFAPMPSSCSKNASRLRDLTLAGTWENRQAPECRTIFTFTSFRDGWAT